MEVLYSGALDGLTKEMFDGITAIWDGPAIVLVSDLDGSTRVICGAFFGGGVDGDEDAMRRGCVFQLSPIHRVFRCSVSFGSGGDVGGGNCISDPEGRLVLEEGMQAGIFDFPRYGDITDEINST
jgi:hypothetical protein